MKEREQLRRRARTALMHAALMLDDPFYGSVEEALALAATAVMHMKNMPGVADGAYDLVEKFVAKRDRNNELASLDYPATD